MAHYLASLDAFLLWFALSIVLSAAFMAIYLWITPHDELRLIREGNRSAALCLSGTLLGYVLPLASALMHGADIYDFAIWGVVAMLVQIAVYLLMRLLVRDLIHDIIEDRLSVAIFAASLSLAVGILNAAALGS
jgi:putative membrane protein